MMIALFAVMELFILIAVVFLWNKQRYLKKRLKDLISCLKDMEQGNGQRKMLADPKEETAEICFCLNHIVEQYEEQITLLKKQKRAQKQLLASLSHDLRTPLSSLIGYLEAVDENYVPDERKAEYINTAKNKAHDLKARVDDLFDWFKLDAGETVFYFDKLDICELTREVVADFIPIFEKNGIHYHVSIPERELVCHLDAQAYRRMLGNLVRNALEHSGGSILSILVKEQTASVEISVCDNGIGIKERDLNHLFERLYRCDRSRTGKNSGLGLSITMALAEAHGGSVEAISELGRGSTFKLYIPKRINA